MTLTKPNPVEQMILNAATKPESSKRLCSTGTQDYRGEHDDVERIERTGGIG